MMVNSGVYLILNETFLQSMPFGIGDSIEWSCDLSLIK